VQDVVVEELSSVVAIEAKQLKRQRFLDVLQRAQGAFLTPIPHRA
jgi:hypothetical protein